jgi:alcohol dehydrogenase class IV
MNMNEYISNGSIKKLNKIIKKNKFKKAFYITGNSALEQVNIEKVQKIIENNCNIFHYNEISPTPNIEGVKRALTSFKKGHYDVIIAMGGGSVLDIGKSVSIFCTNKGKIEDYLLKRKNFTQQSIPLVLIPTTAGTGSETTHFAVLFINNTKYSLTDKKFLYADYAIVDPELTYSLPKKVTAYTGMDALSQAIESFWNINSTKESKKYAKKAIQLIMENLFKAVNDPDESSRYNMALAANYAGKAINITKTTACHAISYPITSYFNVPHGQAVALSLPSMIVFNSEVSEGDVLDLRGSDYVKNVLKELVMLLNATSFIEAKKEIIELLEAIGLETKLSALGIVDPEDFEIIIRNGFNPERVKNNPRLLTETQLRNILNEIK